ncbi:tetratricopeptide repeat protein [Kordiimonas sp.]|uniref:tetratricopeptide repeat protein n=1 Tax=Kordiimonas sp. TaxID=1970157 RepID=UPI003A8CEEB8
MLRSPLFAFAVFLLLGFGGLPAFGDEGCGQCHGDTHQKWQMSDHASAMQEASEATVLGDFSGLSVAHHGQVTTFTRAGEAYQVTITGADGGADTYRIRYTFGHYPLQQYLVATTDGRYQVLPVAWDARIEEEGGQRWFHLYPDDYLPKGDRLHWQQPLQNWNGMCADCHSTGLRRGYDDRRDLFETTFEAVNVACGSCHAGAEDHAAAMEGRDEGEPDGWKDQLVAYLREIEPFTFAPDRDTAHVSDPVARQGREIEVCAACHALRSPLTDGFVPSQPFLDQFSPTLLDEPLYFADGQIRDEVYVWGSFLQSKMYASGVTCSDCHDSHSLQPKAQGNALCTQCHKTEVFDTPQHHRHVRGTPASECVTCHMPARTYMGVDARRDHSFKVPRPDISVPVGSPNACVSCHSDKADVWAAETLRRWYPGAAARPRDQSALAVYQARQGNPHARVGLEAIIRNTGNPAILRATALSLVPRVGTRELTELATGYLDDPSPLVRIGAIRAQAGLSAADRRTWVSPLLQDDVKAVRVEAARALVDSADAALHEPAFTEMMQADSGAAWRAEGRMNLALGFEHAGDVSAAEEAYRQALRQEPHFAPAIINLANLLARAGREDEAQEQLLQAANAPPVDASVLHALGLSFVRRSDLRAATGYLEKAARADHSNPRYVYVYLVALQNTGREEEAYEGLAQALDKHPYDPDLLSFALSVALKREDMTWVRDVLPRLQALFPGTPAYDALAIGLGLPVAYH